MAELTNDPQFKKRLEELAPVIDDLKKQSEKNKSN